jgi:hypothetical protein
MTRLTHTGNAEWSLLDHLVGEGEQIWRHLDAERPSGLQVDDELEPGRLHDRQVGGLGAPEDFAGIDADLTNTVRDVGSVAHQPAGCDMFTIRINRRNPVARRQGGKLQTAVAEESVASDEEGIGALARKGGKGRIDLADRSGVEYLDLQPTTRPIRLIQQLPGASLQSCWPTSISGRRGHYRARSLYYQYCCFQFPGHRPAIS